MIPRPRLVLLVVLTMALVVGLSHHYGFLRGESVGAVGATLEGATAFVVGLGAAAVVLTVGSVAKPLVSWEDARRGHGGGQGKSQHLRRVLPDEAVAQ